MIEHSCGECGGVLALLLREPRAILQQLRLRCDQPRLALLLPLPQVFGLPPPLLSLLLALLGLAGQALPVALHCCKLFAQLALAILRCPFALDWCEV